MLVETTHLTEFEYYTHQVGVPKTWRTLGWVVWGMVGCRLRNTPLHTYINTPNLIAVSQTILA